VPAISAAKRTDSGTFGDTNHISDKASRTAQPQRKVRGVHGIRVTPENSCAARNKAGVGDKLTVDGT